MRDPRAVSDSVGEWIEVYNASGLAVELAGLEIYNLESDGVTPDQRFVVSESVIASPGVYVVLGRLADPATNGGVTVDSVYTDVSHGNFKGSIVLAAAGGVIDEVTWDYGTVSFYGATDTLDAAYLDATSNDDPSHWCAATTPYSEEGCNQFLVAVQDCASDGMRLCSTSEWAGACWASPTGLNDMSGNYEIVADLTTASSFIITGSAGCSNFGEAACGTDGNIGQALAYRCCR